MQVRLLHQRQVSGFRDAQALAEAWRKAELLREVNPNIGVPGKLKATGDHHVLKSTFRKPLQFP